MMSSGDALMMSAHTGWLFAGWLSHHVQTQGHMLYMAQFVITEQLFNAGWCHYLKAE